MINQPVAVTPAEIKEMASSRELQDYWGGFDSAEEFEECLKGDYIVKFNFINGSPGYSGELFIIQSDHLSKEVPAVRLTRGKDGQLVIV